MSRGLRSGSRGVVVSGRGVITGEAGTLTWETATDWDNAVSESGVVHESVSNTDHGDATVLKQGYGISTPYLSSNTLRYYPLHEDSGTTIYDFSGGNNDGTYDGPTLGQTGLLGTTSPDFDGTDDYGSTPSYSLSYSSSFSISLWSNASNVSTGDQVPFGGMNSSNFYPAIVLYYRDPNDENEFQAHLRDDSNNTVTAGNGSGNLIEGSWVHLVLVWDTSDTTLYLYVDGSQGGTADGSSLGSYTNEPLDIGRRGGTNSNYLQGKAANVRVFDKALSSSEVSTLYNVVDTVGTLTTATKSFSSSATPDLQNLDYTLNGVTDIQLDIIGSPGTGSEETVTQQLSGASSYTLTWSNSHTDFRLKAYPDNENDPTRTPTINRLELVS